MLCLTLNYGRKQDDKVTMPIKEWYISSQGDRELLGKDKSLVAVVREVLILDLHKLWTSPLNCRKIANCEAQIHQVGTARFPKPSNKVLKSLNLG